ncbi:hypothetical protein LUZ60_002708 [Juncus effusus]|nr:hypothetical protein LUZ60_002708 [Juncus effusus]
MDLDTELYYDFSPFLLHYKSGRIERLIPTDFIPAGHDPITGVTSKDVKIDPETGISARIYIPNISNNTQDEENSPRLPTLIFFHGGGFVLQSAFSSVYHGYINSLVSKARVVAVSVEYRLAPEHLLPTAYDDSYLALKWVVSNCSSDPNTDAWISQHGDPSCIFIAGDSAGGNIAHNMVVKASKDGIMIKGLLLLHPYFWGKDLVGFESTDPEIRTGAEKSWNYICGGSFGIDHPCVNPVGPTAELEKLGCERVLVAVAENDHFRERGKAYVERLKKSGWQGEAELLVSQGEEHVFFLGKPQCEKASKQMELVVSFLNEKFTTNL